LFYFDVYEIFLKAAYNKQNHTQNRNTHMSKPLGFHTPAECFGEPTVKPWSTLSYETALLRNTNNNNCGGGGAYQDRLSTTTTTTATTRHDNHATMTVQNKLIAKKIVLLSCSSFQLLALQERTIDNELEVLPCQEQEKESPGQVQESCVVEKIKFCEKEYMIATTGEERTTTATKKHCTELFLRAFLSLWQKTTTNPEEALQKEVSYDIVMRIQMYTKMTPQQDDHYDNHQYAQIIHDEILGPWLQMSNIFGLWDENTESFTPHGVLLCRSLPYGVLHLHLIWLEQCIQKKGHGSRLIRFLQQTQQRQQEKIKHEEMKHVGNDFYNSDSDSGSSSSSSSIRLVSYPDKIEFYKHLGFLECKSNQITPILGQTLPGESEMVWFTSM